MAEPHDPETEAAQLRRQSAALAAFGGHALRERDLDALLLEACQQVSDAVGTELVKVVELLPDGETMLIRQGVNWQPGVVGQVTFPAHRGSPSGYALDIDQPVISLDMDREDRYEIPQVLLDHGIKSTINVVMRGGGAPWGVLEVDSPRHRAWNDDDVAFLQNYSNLLAGAIDRLKREEELRAAAETTEMLLAELQHRVRNMLMNVGALARRTAKGKRDLDDFLPTFEARLAALGRSQDLLSQGTDSASLGEALHQELLAHGAEASRNVEIAGPDIRLPTRIAQALGMAFHELATNSVKHGALKVPGARIDIRWEPVPRGEDTELLICWRESGVPMAAPPERRGYGSETIEKTLPHIVGGESRLDFRPDGIEWTVRFPLPREAAA